MHSKFIYRIASFSLAVALLAGTSWAVYAHSQSQLTAAAVSHTFVPVADAYVIQSSPTVNYGSSHTLHADASPVTRTYVRFAVSGLSGTTVQSAVLRFYTGSSSSTGFSVSALANNTWTESAITYNNAPLPGAVINRSTSFASGIWISVNISSYVKGNGTYNLVITTANANVIKLSSREAGSKAPQLVISTVPASTATPTLPALQVPTATRTTLPTQTATFAPTTTSLPTQTATLVPTATALSTNTATSVPTSTTMPSPVPTTQSSWQPSFPIRAAFYYPWFPEAWTQLGIYPYTNYHPQLGFYDSSDSTILKQHIAMMQYGGIQAGIASWWGQGSKSDSRIPALLSAASGTNFRWSLYYEMESQGDPASSQIQNDLTYIRDHYAADPSYLRVNGKFVVFVYADGNDACGMADRWKQGNTVGAYVVLKVFSGYLNCASQPDDWHQYAPAVAEDQQGSHSFSISPGFWLVGNAVRLTRDLTRWTQNVKDMVASGSRWQLVTTFSEWGEGTAVEPATEWASTSGYGQYLDALHYNGNMP
jgi:hypothetical protein